MGFPLQLEQSFMHIEPERTDKPDGERRNVARAERRIGHGIIATEQRAAGFLPSVLFRLGQEWSNTFFADGDPSPER